MNARLPAWIAAGVALGAGVLWAASRIADGDPAAPPAHALDAVPDPRKQAPVVHAVTLPPTPTAAVDGKETAWLLPDGSQVPMLNGATASKPLRDAWPAGRPWSPIVRVERSDIGVDWYVHADGCRSTTEMKWRADLGRMDAVTRLAQPAPQPPASIPAPQRPQ